MAQPVKKFDCLKLPKMEMIVQEDSADSIETLTDEEVVDYDCEISSNFVGVKLIIFEHSYMKNYADLYEKYMQSLPEKEKYEEKHFYDSEPATTEILIKKKVSSVETKAPKSENIFSLKQSTEAQKQCESSKPELLENLSQSKELTESRKGYVISNSEINHDDSSKMLIQSNEQSKLLESEKLLEDLPSSQELSQAEIKSQLSSSEELHRDFTTSKELNETENQCKLHENSSPSKELTQAEELHKETECIKTSNTQVPVRRSLRQINKIDKDAIINNTNSVCSEANTEKVHLNANKTIVSKQVAVNKIKNRKECKNTNDEIVDSDAEMHSKNDNAQSPLRKNAKRLKLPEMNVGVQKNYIDVMKVSTDDFITEESEEVLKKDDLTNIRPRRKRAFSEPSKSDIDSSDVEICESQKFKNKKLKSLVKFKGPVKTKIGKLKVHSNNLQRKKRNLSSQSDKVFKEELTINAKKSPESPSKRRKKCLSLSEDSAPNELHKTENRKDSLPESVTTIELASPPSNITTKPKIKKIRKDSLRFIMNDNEPALFSQPDVMVKVKTDDGIKKEIKCTIKDKKNISDVENFDVSQVTNSEPQSEVSDIKIDEPSSHTENAQSVTPSDNTFSKIDDLSSEYVPEKDMIKDVDSENSLQIDESICKNLEEENVNVLDKEPSDVNSNISTEKSTKNKNKHLKTDDDVKELICNEPKDIKSNVEDLDCDKPIAERKPRRTIKKKEFFEDIASNSTPARKSCGRQKGAEKKATKEESKQAKKKSTKVEVESEEEDEEEEEEDDPNKLWCICRQPHNDRFMIMCDSCEDWFHGNCVGISWQKGRKLEKLKMEWICPKCEKKGMETVSVESSTEKKYEPEIKKMVSEKTVPESKNAVINVNVQTSKKGKNDKNSKSETKSTQDKQVSPLSSSNSAISTPSTPKDEKTVNPIIVTKKSFNKNILNAPKGTESVSITRKGLKEPLRKKQTCVSCHAVVQSINSCYCNDKCLEKHAADCLAAMKEGKDALKGPEFESQKIVVLDRVKGTVIAGDNAPTAGNIVSWLKANPCYMIALSSSSASSSKTASQKKETDITSKEKREASDEAKAKVRSNVRKTLKNILMDRVNFVGDIQMKEEEVGKIAAEIEAELNFLFKDNSFKYRAKYRSLMFNIKDPRNQGLFRKILKGSIPPDKLVRMSPEELASVELAKWREKENQHSLDIIKRVQLEQQSATGLLLKKTHKGEVEIEDDFNVIDEIPKTTLRPLSCEPPDEPKQEPEKEKEIIKDTTPQHRSHLFDLNCKICTGKVLPPPVEDNMPKKVHVAHSISVDLSSPVTVDPVEKSVARIVDGKSPLSSADESLDHEPASTVSGSSNTSLRNPSKVTAQAAIPAWRGYIFMHEVTKFNACAYKVSGDTASDLDVSKVLDVCGRIAPDQVWDYLGKIKQSGNKELIIIRFKHVEDSAAAYDSFFQYLSTRKRYGVIKVDKKSGFSKHIKDFYILPLAATSPVPVVLMPFDGPGLPTPRTNLLIGVIVRHKVNTSAPEKKKVISPPVSKRKKSKESIEKSYTPPPETRSYTPPLPATQAENSPATTVSSSSPSVSPSESSVHFYARDFYSPSMSNISPEKTDITNIACTPPGECNSEPYDPSHNSYLPSGETNSDIYEPSLTPPLHLLIDLPKKGEENKPYDPEQDILNVTAASKTPESSPKDDENLEKEKKVLYALRKELEETNRKVNELKQSNPDDTASAYHSPNDQSLDISSVAASGMSSFLPENMTENAKCYLPENLQDLINSVREKPFSTEKSANKGDVDMRIRSLFQNSFNSSDCRTVTEANKLTNLQDKSNSSSATPPLDEDRENSRSLSHLSDPRIKIRTSFQESFSEEPASVSLSSMSVSELVERAEKELAVMDDVEKAKNVSPMQERLTAAEIDSLPPTCWSEFKEPPPPGIELSELTSPDSAFSSKTQSLKSDNSLPSPFSSPVVQEAQHIAPHFPPPPTFPPPLPPGFPPPNLKHFPPPNVLSTSFAPPPPPPVVTKSSDINPVNDSWSSWNISPQQSKDSTWQNQGPQWDENWKSSTESALVDCAESSSHYYPPGTSEFHKESFYRGESSESRWNRPHRFGRNNWHKHPPRGGRWRGRRGSFYFNKNQRNG